MYARFAFAVLIAVFALQRPAQADVYAAGPVYGGNPTSGFVTCRVMNAGISTVSITTRQIITNTNSFIAPTSDSCTVALTPGRTCSYGAPVGGNFALACRLYATGIAVQVTGSIDVQRPIGTVLVVTPLQKQ